MGQGLQAEGEGRAHLAHSTSSTVFRLSEVRPLRCLRDLSVPRGRKAPPPTMYFTHRLMPGHVSHPPGAPKLPPCPSQLPHVSGPPLLSFPCGSFPLQKTVFVTPLELTKATVQGLLSQEPTPRSAFP